MKGLIFVAENNEIMGGFALYEGEEFDWNKFLELLEEEWNIIPQNSVEDNTLAFIVNDMNVAVVFKNEKVEDGEAEEAATYNVLWQNGKEAVSKHKSQAVLVVTERITPIAQAILFAKIACCLMKMPGAIGLYKQPTVYEKNFYIQFAETIREGALPMPILVFTGIYHNENGFTAFTAGMRFFGKEEIEIVNSKNDPDEIMGLLISVAEYCVGENVDLADGETVGFSDTQKIPVKISEGVSVTGNSVKLLF